MEDDNNYHGEPSQVEPLLTYSRNSIIAEQKEIENNGIVKTWEKDRVIWRKHVITFCREKKGKRELQSEERIRFRSRSAARSHKIKKETGVQ